MSRKSILAIILLLAFASGILVGCGGGGGRLQSTAFVLTDSSGLPITGKAALASNHGVSASVQGFGSHDQAAFLFTGPTGSTVHPPYGLPACSYYTIYSVDKTGSLPPVLVSPKLPAGSYTLQMYDVSTSGTKKAFVLVSTSSLTVADSPPNVPTAQVGLLNAATFTATDSFVPGNNAYVKASGFQPGQTVDLYVTAHKFAWSPGDSLVDVSGTAPDAAINLPNGARAARPAARSANTRALKGTAKTVTADANGNFGPIIVWQSIAAQADQSEFDVVVDTSQSGLYDPAHDLVLDQATGSFVVDSVNRAAPGGNNVTLAYNQAMVLSRSFGQVDNVRTQLSSRAVMPTPNPSAGIAICKHKSVWLKDDAIEDVSGPGGINDENWVSIVNNRLVVPPMFAYHADLLPGDYDIIVNVGATSKFDPARDFIDGGASGPAFTVTGAAPNKKWTVMVYLDGDNSLSNDAKTNFMEMESVSYLVNAGKSDVNVVVQYADAGANTNRYIVAHTTDPTQITTNPIASLGQVNMADPNQLAQFITWAKHVSPADHYALILWDHGTGFTSRATNLSPTRNVLWADSFGSQSMTVPQVHNVLKQAGHFDLLACDACLMGMTEIAYEMRDVCSVFNGSEDLEPAHGYNYAAFLTDLVASPNMTAPQLGTSIVNAYKSWYTSNPDSTVTCSSTDESKIAGVETAINGVVAALIDIPPGSTKSVLDTGTNKADILSLTYQTFQAPRFTYADGVDWFTQLKTLNLSSGINSACDAVTAAYAHANIAEYHIPSYTGANGLTIWLPSQSTFTNFNSEYRDLLFAKDSRWLDFCILLLNQGSKITPTAATISVNGSATFTASTNTAIPSGAGLGYRWVTTGKNGVLSDSKGHTGTSFTSTDSSVRYTAKSGATGQDTVTADVIIISGNQKTDLGPATANVSITNALTFSATAGTDIYYYPDGTETVYGWYGFYDPGPYPTWTKITIDGANVHAVLTKAEYDADGPVHFDPNNINTWIPIANTNLYHTGYGIAYLAYGGPPGSQRYPHSQEQPHYDAAWKIISNPVTVTIE